MSDTYPINYKKGIENFGGDEDMFYGLIGQFESLSFNDSLTRVYESMKNKDWANLRTEAHTLKGASSYIAAEKFSQSALNLQLAAESKKERDIKERYLELMIEAKNLKIHIAHLTKNEPDTTAVDLYISEFQPVRHMISMQTSEKNIACCKGCKIF